MSLRQLAILALVVVQPPPHTVRGLARRAGLSKPVVCRALDVLCRRGLLLRRPDSEDRRSVLVSATPLGHEHLLVLTDQVQALLVAASSDGRTA